MKRPSTPLSALDASGAPAIPLTLHNIARLRADTWNRLRDLARRLRRTQREDASANLLQTGIREAIGFLEQLEGYFSFPGMRILAHLGRLLDEGEFEDLATISIRVARLRSSGAYRRLDLASVRAHDYLDFLTGDGVGIRETAMDEPVEEADRLYFELLVVDDISIKEERELRQQLRGFRRDNDRFIYELVVARSFEDAVLAVLANPGIAAVVTRYSFPFSGNADADLLEPLYHLLGEDRDRLAALMPGARTAELGRLLKDLRPEIDLYRVTDAPIESVIGRGESPFRRLFYQAEDLQDQHVSFLKGVHDRFETPFFDALRRYSEKPTGMFHALPVSRGRTIAKSKWIRDFGDFYGSQLFFAETSATTGGLDSLLQPTGSLKRAQELAARAFGSERTFFVTNGTSTANKIVMQALIQPGDIVLLSHDCHKSHPYAVILAGASPIYLDPYPLPEYSMYGGVALDEIKRQLLELKAAGKLDRVRLLLLTNVTFDGITYDPYRVMKEILAIKPDILFLWDEAWFAYGRFTPVLRQRTAMHAARRLERELRSDAYRATYDAWRAAFGTPEPSDPRWMAQLLPDPEHARVRVYATQSTHKTLTSLRQGSMIHVRDSEFERRAEEPFHEAYMTHTSTSPNYQILASLDVGRRQVELEGLDLVGESFELAMTLRERISEDPLLERFFRVLGPKDMIPEEHRPSGIHRYWDPITRHGPVEHAWTGDEFVLDPTRVTLHVGRSGYDGDSFKGLLMNKYDIHINKTSRNTVLFLIHIGMTRGTIAHLVKVLTDIATDLARTLEHASAAEHAAFDRKVASLTEELPPLPNFSRFHRIFLPDPKSTTPEGDIRRAYFQAYDEESCEFIPFDASLLARVAERRELVSASFITPYPPGFPVLVPGQVITKEIVSFLLALDVKEIHGMKPGLGIRIFKDSVLGALARLKAPVGLEAERPS